MSLRWSTRCTPLVDGASQVIYSRSPRRIAAWLALAGRKPCSTGHFGGAKVPLDGVKIFLPGLDLFTEAEVGRDFQAGPVRVLADICK